MAKAKDKGPRILTCQATRVKFEYRGFGRPPLYCPAEKARRLGEQRKKSRANAKAKKKAA